MPGLEDGWTHARNAGRRLRKQPAELIEELTRGGAVDANTEHRTTTTQQRRDIRRLLRGSLYSGLRPRPPREQYPVDRVMGFALDLAEAMLRSGANSRDTEVAAVAVTATWELAPLEMEITAASVRLQYSPHDGPPITEMRVVRDIGDDLTALSGLYKLVDDVVYGRLDIAAASARLVAIETAGPRWPAPLQFTAMGVLGATLSFLSGGNVRSAAWAFVLVSLTVMLARWAGRWTMPPFFLVAAQSAFGLAVGSAALGLGWLGPRESATTVAPLLVLLLPHPAIVAWAQDAITGFRDPANARALSIALVVLGVLLGVPAGAAATSWVHVEVDPTQIKLLPLTLPFALLASVIAALANGIVQGTTARALPFIAVAALLTSACQRFFLSIDFGQLFATFAAATVLGIVCTLAAARLRTAVTVLAVPAFCGALLPALAVADSLLNLVAGTSGAQQDFLLALLITLAIGAGLVLGTYSSTPLVRRLASARSARLPRDQVEQSASAQP